MDQGYMMQQPNQSLGSMFVGQQQYVPQQQQQSYSRPVQQQSSRMYRPSSSQQQQPSSRYSSQPQSSRYSSQQQSSQRTSRPAASSRVQAAPKAPARAVVQKKVIGTRVSVTNLHAVATADDIEELFENIGKVTSAK